MALSCRWRSRPQHHERTHAAQQIARHSITSSSVPRVTLHGLDQVGDQVVTSSLGIPVAADSCDATLAASLNVELPMNVKLPKGIACPAPDFNRTYTP